MSRFTHPADMNPDSSDPRSPFYDSSREEWIAERADELFEQRMADHEAMTDVIEEVLGFSDWSDYLAKDMANVLMASVAAFEAEAIQFFARLYRRVKKDIRAAAESDAESERDRWEDEQEEARADSRTDRWEDEA